MLLFRYFYMFYVLDFCDVKFLKIYCFKFFGCVLKYDKLEGGILGFFYGIECLKLKV